MAYYWFDKINDELLQILLRYAEARYPREKASYLQVAIGRMLAHAPRKDIREKLEELSERIHRVSYGYHWELYMAYAFGNYSLLEDSEYREMIKALKTLDDVALELSKILGEIYLYLLEEYEKLRSKKSL